MDSYNVSGLACGTTYRFAIKGYGDGQKFAADWGEYSRLLATTHTCPTPTITISGLVTSMVEGDDDSFTVSASNLVSSHSYTIRVTTNNGDIGFDSSCSDRQEDVTVPSNRTSYAATFTLHGCDTSGGRVTATLRRGSTSVATNYEDVSVTAAPSIDITSLGHSMVAGESDPFTVSVSNLVSSHSYTILVTTNNGDIGFNSSCSDREEDATVPSNRTSYTATFTLHGCDTTGGTVTATLRRGSTSVTTHGQSVSVTAAPSIDITSLGHSMVAGESDSFTVSASNLVSSYSYTIRVTTSDDDIGFNSSCSDRQEDATIPAGRTSYSTTFTLHGCNTSGGKVTATLRHGSTSVATDRQDVSVTGPSIEILNLVSSMDVGESDAFIVWASNLDTAITYTIDTEVTTNDSNSIGFNDSCTSTSRTETVSSDSSVSNGFTLHGCAATVGTVTATLRRGSTYIATDQQNVSVIFQFTPNHLALGERSNVWTVPSSVTNIYVDVDFSTGSRNDSNVGAIDINRVDSSGAVLNTLTVDAESDSGRLPGAMSGSRIRIDVDNDAFDADAGLVTLTFHSGSNATDPVLARATVQTEERPAIQVSGSATVNEAVGTITLTWTEGTTPTGSNPHHYEVVISDSSNPSTPLYSNDNVTATSLTISDAGTLGLEGTHTAEVRHCNAAGGCSQSLSITFTYTPFPTVGPSTTQVDATGATVAVNYNLNSPDFNTFNYWLRLQWGPAGIDENEREIRLLAATDDPYQFTGLSPKVNGLYRACNLKSNGYRKITVTSKLRLPKG